MLEPPTCCFIFFEDSTRVSTTKNQIIDSASTGPSRAPYWHNSMPDWRALIIPAAVSLRATESRGVTSSRITRARLVCPTRDPREFPGRRGRLELRIFWNIHVRAMKIAITTKEARPVIHFCE